MADRDDYNKGGLIAFVFCMVFSFCFFTYVSFIHPGIDLKQLKDDVDVTATTAEAAPTAVKVDIAKIKEPWKDNPDVVAYGKQAFQTTCAICHGPEGHGDGPAGKALQPPPRNLVEGKWKRGHGSSMDIFTTVTTGLTGTNMAPFGHLPVADRWAIVQFVRSITKNKPAKEDMAALDKFAATAK